MSEKSEALQLADALDECKYVDVYRCKQAAAELRRLLAENERLHQINQSHEMKLSVRGYEIQIADLEAQRDALLEALKEIVAATDSDEWNPVCTVKARAAIKRVEEGK